MRYSYNILLLILLLPLFAPQQLLARDNSIYVVKGNMQRLKDELIVSFELSINQKLLPNESVVLEPIIYDSLGRKESLPKIYINSRRQQIMYKRGFYGDHDLTNTIEHKNGNKQSFCYLESLPYSDWMKSALLTVKEESCGCGLPIASNISFTAEITTPASMFADLPTLACVMPEETAIKIRTDKGSAFILFPLNDTVLHPLYGDNEIELEKIVNSINIIAQDSTCVVTDVYIHGYASPEGPYKTNERLSKGRTNSVVEYVNNICNFPEDILVAEYTAEDWEGFEALLINSSYINKSEVLKIIRSNQTPDQKERTIRKKYPQFFNMLLDDWFIMLRHTDYIIKYEVCFFSTIEEIEQIYHSNPRNLSHNELFQLSQRYSNGSDEQYDIFLKSVSLYPEDPIANLNAAGVALRRRNLTAAKQYIDLSPECGEKDLALGVYHLLSEDYDKASHYINRSNQMGVSESEQYLNILQSIYR